MNYAVKTTLYLESSRKYTFAVPRLSKSLCSFPCLLKSPCPCLSKCLYTCPCLVSISVSVCVSVFTVNPSLSVKESLLFTSSHLSYSLQLHSSHSLFVCCTVLSQSCYIFLSYSSGFLKWKFLTFQIKVLCPSQIFIVQNIVEVYKILWFSKFFIHIHTHMYWHIFPR